MDKAIVCSDFADPGSIRFCETDWKVLNEYWIKITPGDSSMVGTVFPVKYEAELREIVAKRAALKKAYDDSMSLVYALVNKVNEEKRKP